jgi:Cu2+-exporting ATPase
VGVGLDYRVGTGIAQGVGLPMNAATLVADDTEPGRTAAGAADGAARAAAPRPAAPEGVDVLDDPLELARFTRWIVLPTGERLGESSLQLAGIHCAACAGQIEAALLAVAGVREAHVAAASQRASITWDPQQTRPSAWVAAVRRAGYDAAPDAAAPARALRQREQRQALWRLFVAAFCAMQVMMLATPSYVADVREIGAEMRRLLDWGGWLLTLPVLAFSCTPFFAGAWRGLRAGRLGMDVPVTLGILITFMASTGAAFDPGGVFGSEVYFDSLTMFVSFLLGARYLEMRARHGAAEALEASLARLPETAERVRDDGSVESVSVLRLRPGDRVRVALGQAFAADGELLEGSTRCDESLLSGESLPVPRREGDAVVAGSLNVGAPVLMRVHRVGPDTRYEGIVAMMRSAATQRPALARLADRWAVPFLWVVLLLAAGGAAAWSFIDPARAVWVAVAVLIVTCPCALSLAAPATLLAAARGLSQRGVLVCRLGAIEALARVDQVFFDKTGTLTSELPRLARVMLDDVGRRELGSEAQALAVAALLAAQSRHPLSQALAGAEAAEVAGAAGAAGAAAGAAGPAINSLTDRPVPRLTQFQEAAGQGVQGVDERGRRWRLGARRWVAAACEPKGTIGEEAEREARVWLGCEGALLAGFELEESLREGADEAVAELRRQGVRVTLLSGDHAPRARALGVRLGIDDVVAEATPADKLAVVGAAQAAGRRVAMVGDGINDAPVLARADVAVAMGQGALLARSQADLVLSAARPLDLLQAQRVARRAVRVVHENLLWAAAYNAVSVPLALVGWLPPWAAGLGMATSSLLVVANAMRAAR